MKAQVVTSEPSPFDYGYDCFLPVNLDIDQLLHQNPPLVKHYNDRPDKIKDRLVYVASAYYRSRLVLDILEMDDDVFVPINAKVLQCTFPGYKDYVDYLVNLRIFETDGTWSAWSHKSRKFRFTRKFRNKGLKKYVIFDQQFIKQINKYRIDKSVIDQYPVLFEWLHHIRIDERLALRRLRSLSRSGVVTRPEFQEQLIRAVNNPVAWMFHTSETGRLFTHLCYLKRELREFLSFNHIEELVKLDISNCTPYVSIALLDPILIPRLNIFGEVQRVNPDLDKSNLIMIQEILNGEELAEDIANYREAVVSGVFYDYIQEIVKIAYHKDYTRSEIKKKVLSVLNRPPDMEDHVSRAMYHLYPNVMQAFREYADGYYKIKRGSGKRKWQPGDISSPIAHLTQGLESRIVLDNIVPRITEFNPEIPIYTIHDCIMTTEQHTEVVRRIMKNTFEEFLYVAPMIKIED